MTTILMSSCIKNDFPYPVIKGDVLIFKAQGEVESSIDHTKQKIDVILGESVDPRKVAISELKITENATSDLDSNSVIDLTKNFNFTITTYQEYKWQISATQPVERYFNVENQVGTTNIDPKSRIVMVYVPKTQDLARIKVSGAKLGPKNAATLPEPTQTTNFTRPQIFLVKYFDTVEEWKVYVLRNE